MSLVELAHRSRSQAMDGHDVVVAIDGDPEIQTVWVDASLFRLVFDNLVQNACQSMRGGGRVDGTGVQRPPLTVEGLDAVDDRQVAV